MRPPNPPFLLKEIADSGIASLLLIAHGTSELHLLHGKRGLSGEASEVDKSGDSARGVLSGIKERRVHSLIITIDN